MDETIDITTTFSQYLTFSLGGEVFGLEINRVREVMDHAGITRVPRMPEHLRGVINLRGNIVSVVDLGIVLGMETVGQTVDTCIIVVEIGTPDDPLRMGLIADSVREVIHLDPEKIEPPPEVGIRLNPDYIRGIARQDNSFFIILDIDRVLALDVSENESSIMEDSALEKVSP